MKSQSTSRNYAVHVLQLLAGVGIIIGLILVVQYASDTFQEQTVPEGWSIIRPPGEVSALVIDGDIVWTGGKDGLIPVNRTTGRQMTLPVGYPHISHVRSLVIDQQGWLWIAHDGGLIKYKDGDWTIISPADDIPFTGAQAVLEDRDGHIWIGGERVLARYDGTTWTTFEPPGGWQIPSVDVLYQDRNSIFWMGSVAPTTGGLYRFDTVEWTLFSVDDGLPHNTIKEITETPDGTLWIGTGFSTRGGALGIKDGTWTTLYPDDGLAGNSTRSIYEDTSGRMWFASEYDGVSIQYGGNRTILTTENGLAGNEIKAIVEDRDGTWWLGTSGGLNCVERDSLFGCGCT
jgi:ligand-binding sensor domain-containing protein